MQVNVNVNKEDIGHGGGPQLLTVNIAHTAEHYGNIITYLRLKNIVPPSSEPAVPAPPKK
jgi:hypothetical protein